MENNKDYVKLTHALKGFEKADTQSNVQGLIQPGKYLVKEILTNHPDETTDFASIEVPALGDEDTWICTRWQQSSYAAFTGAEDKKMEIIDFSSDNMAIPESALTDLLKIFAPFTYDLDQARYPYAIQGFSAPQAPPQTNNCCTFVEALVAKAWENANGLSWSMDNHKQMMIFSADDYFSPVTCLLNQDIAIPAEDDNQRPHPWTVIQGWRKQWTSGHTFIILDYHQDTDRILTLESNAAYGLNGVGFRMLGNYRDVENPGAAWWQSDRLWTWERLKSVYQFRKQAILKVKNRSWLASK